MNEGIARVHYYDELNDTGTVLATADGTGYIIEWDIDGAIDEVCPYYKNGVNLWVTSDPFGDIEINGAHHSVVAVTQESE